MEPPTTVPATLAAATAEAARLEVLRRYDILDTPPDGSFDHVTALTARLFAVPIAIISLVDTDRIWFKSHQGVDVEQIEREPGLCASAILGDVPYVVTDALSDPRTLANPLVAGTFGLRFYLAVPLRTHDGYNLGTLCVIDRKPRTVSTDEIAMLESLAMVVMDQMELRLSARRAIDELSLSLSRAQMLGREIDHRVMNNLQLVVGVLDLQAQASPHAEAANQLEIAAQRIRTIARVHQHFYLDEAIESTDALTYLRRLCTDFGDILGGASMAVEGSPVIVATSKIMPLGVIVNELATNAAKYGASHIVLRVQPLADGLQLSLRDDGDGLPADFDPAAHKGLGMRVIGMLAQQLNARLTFGPNPDGRGSCFTLVVSNALER